MKQQYGQILTPPKPFVKWAGGKRQLVTVLDAHLPRSFGAYLEPFLGGGALLFHILTGKPRQRCHISDINSDLILAYATIRDRVDDLIVSLQQHEKNYQKNPKSYYYSIRQENPTSKIERVSRLLFLNKTCFNGLYRVNSKGKFNVPLGRYSNPNIVNKVNLLNASRILQSGDMSIRCQDFEAVLDDAKKGDLVYFDPPYMPVSRTASFTSYTDKDFTLDDLSRLAKVCRDLDSRGCMVLLSNSDSRTVSEMFSDVQWKIHRIHANRAINSNSGGRSGHFELLIKNY